MWHPFLNCTQNLNTTQENTITYQCCQDYSRHQCENNYRSNNDQQVIKLEGTTITLALITCTILHYTMRLLHWYTQAHMTQRSDKIHPHILLMQHIALNVTTYDWYCSPEEVITLIFWYWYKCRWSIFATTNRMCWPAS